MKIVNLKIDDLKRSLMTGGFAYEYNAEPGTVHYVWINKQYVPGVATGDGKVEIPVDTNIPNLFFLVDTMERLGVEPTLYRVKSTAFVGMGVAFHNCLKE